MSSVDVMRIMEIAMFVFSINVAIFMLNGMILIFPDELGALNGTAKSSNMFGADIGSTASGFASQTTNIGGQVSGNSSNSFVNNLGWFNLIWYGFILGIKIVITFLQSMVYGFAMFIETMIPITGIYLIAWPLQIMVWVIYGIGLVQWLGGRGFREYE